VPHDLDGLLQTTLWGATISEVQLQCALVLGDEVDDGLELGGGVLEHLGLTHHGAHEQLVHELVVLTLGLCV
jgi:hypothetical protein